MLGVTVFSQNSKHISTACPVGWHQYGNSCYAFQLRHRLSQLEARKNCEAFGAHLVIIEKPEEQKMIEQYILSRPYFQQIMHDSNDTMRDTAIWTAGFLQEQGHRWFWFWNKSRGGLKYYIEIVYGNWDNGFPARNHTKNMCVSMAGGNGFKWRDSNCSDEMFYICEKSVGAKVPHLRHSHTVATSKSTLTTAPATLSDINLTTASSTAVLRNWPTTKSHVSLTTPPIKIVSCQYPWKQFKSSCYLFKFNERKSFSDARDACSAEHSHLVFIESDEEQQALAHFLNQFPEYRAHYDHSRGSAVWTGGISTSSTGQLYWENQLTHTKYRLTYTNWVKGGNDLDGSSHVCVAVVGNFDSGWKNYPCERTFFYACERSVGFQTPRSSLTPSTATHSQRPTSLSSSQQGSCPPGWNQFRTSCYLINMNDKKTVLKATNACDKLHSHLVFIETEDEQKALNSFLHGYLQYNANQEHSVRSAVWTGGMRTGNNGDWNWKADGTSYHVTYTNWHSTNEKRLNSDVCIAVVGVYHSKWSYYDCDKELYYICERPSSRGPFIVG